MSKTEMVVLRWVGGIGAGVGAFGGAVVAAPGSLIDIGVATACLAIGAGTAAMCAFVRTMAAGEPPPA